MNKTFRGGTETSQGMIPHKRMVVAGHTFDAPVILRGMVKHAGDTNLPIPKMLGDSYMYALPGGGETAGG